MTSSIFIGSYSPPSEVGIHVLQMKQTGSVIPAGEIRGIANPSYLAVRDSGHWLYAVNEVSGPGSITAFSLDSPDSTRVTASSHGTAPCHISLGDNLAYVANYVSGSVAAYKLEPSGEFGEFVGSYQHAGSGPHPRQECSHMHFIRHVQDTPWIYAVDLGTDELILFSAHHVTNGGGLDPAGSTRLTPGSGPRHFVTHPSLPVMYVVCELSCQVAVFDIDLVNGALTERASISALPGGVAHNSSLSAGIAIHPSGSALYVSNRGHDSVATFLLDSDGNPRVLGHSKTGGRTPRDIAIDPSGRWLLVANQDSNSISQLALDGKSAMPTSAVTVAEIPHPSSVTFAEASV